MDVNQLKSETSQKIKKQQVIKLSPQASMEQRRKLWESVGSPPNWPPAKFELL